MVMAGRDEEQTEFIRSIAEGETEANRYYFVANTV